MPLFHGGLALSQEKERRAILDLMRETQNDVLDGADDEFVFEYFVLLGLTATPKNARRIAKHPMRTEGVEEAIAELPEVEA